MKVGSAATISPMDPAKLKSAASDPNGQAHASPSLRPRQESVSAIFSSALYTHGPLKFADMNSEPQVEVGARAK